MPYADKALDYYIIGLMILRELFSMPSGKHVRAMNTPPHKLHFYMERLGMQDLFLLV